LASTPADAQTVTLLAAGDVAGCASTHTGDTRTGNLIRSLPAWPVIALGDLAYRDGTASEFANCYHPTWGSFRSRTWPVPGNHEYNTSGASGFFNYFSGRTTSSGNFSVQYGAWRLIFLNSASASDKEGLSQGALDFLVNNLQASNGACTLVAMHHPRFSNGAAHGNSEDSSVRRAYEIMHGYGADVLLSGHDHAYERFTRLTPAGSTSGGRVMQFVLGTGGVALRGFNVQQSGSLRRFKAHGVTQFNLGSGGFAWWFRGVDGSIKDQGQANCV
jgi:hypothetical protein